MSRTGSTELQPLSLESRRVGMGSTLLQPRSLLLRRLPWDSLSPRSRSRSLRWEDSLWWRSLDSRLDSLLWLLWRSFDSLLDSPWDLLLDSAAVGERDRETRVKAWFIQPA